MATMTNGYQPHREKHNDYTKPKCDFLVTSGSGATSGGIEVFGDPASSNNFYLTSLDISFLAPSANALYTSYIGLTKIATYSTIATNVPVSYHHSYGGVGLNSMDITTTTATVSIVGTGSVTVQFLATGYRLV